ncbi:MAG TPA: tryptophan halogenase family protein [Steroidobacteraceae bacterium]|nr:tryptophan halogenase family protein [Steroidobacteraceae bacterium]
MGEAIQDDNGSAPLRVVIVGGGTAGWMSAACIRRRLRAEDYTVTLIESDEIGTVGVGEATLPHIKIFNDMLGVDEAQFMRETRATFKLGIQFCNWDKAGDCYIHPFGAFGEPWGGVEFQHHYFRAVQAGRQRFPLQDYSYSVVAARSNAFEFPNEDRKSIRSTYSYAYHFDAGLYAAYLRTWAIERGVRRIEGQVCDVGRNPTTGDLTELTLKSGERIAGDLFIDCSGFRSLLLGKILGVAWQDWTHWLPCDRALAVPCKRVGALTPYTRATARRAGWTWRIPLQHRTGNGYVFSSRFIADGEARDALLGVLDGAAQGEPRLLRFAPGRRERAWAGNCVAIGLASGFLEPLESTSIYLIQAAVTDLVNLMPRPGSGTDPRLVDEFNRLNEMQYERIRDFLVLHYTANGRVGEPLWDYVRSMPLPDSLVHKLELFRSRAALPDYKYGLFARDSWLSVLVGQGIIPAGHDRLADAFEFSTLEERLSEFRNRIQTNVDVMSTHGAFIADYAQAAPSEEAA